MKLLRRKLGQQGRNALLCLFAGSVTVAALSACSSEEGPEASSKTQLVEAVTPYSFQVVLPQGEGRALLSASNRLTINGNGSVGLTGTLSTVAGFGAGGQTNVQAGAKIHANLLSVAPVMLNSQSIIYGFAKSSGAVQLQDSTPQVLGGTTSNTPVVSQNKTFSVDWPDQPGTDFVRYAANGSLPPNGNPGESLAPGNYGKFELHDRNRITLTAGQYFFTSFTLYSQAEVRIDSTSGPVQIFVSGSINSQGKILPAINASGTPIVTEGQVLLATRGAGQVILTGSFSGTVVAPNAEIRLNAPNNGGQHKGSFYGKDVTVDSNAQLPVIPLDIDLTDLLDDPDSGGGDSGGEPEGPCADADDDGVCNTDDECDTDPLKSERGLCDCGELDTDTDGDLVPNCDDDEDDDPDVTVTGGCADAEEGTPCVNSVAGGIPDTCNSNGTCGSPDPGRPGGEDGDDCFSIARKFDGIAHHYWFCPGPVDWQTAQDRCLEVPGRSLVLPSSTTDNNWLDSVAGFDAWIGVKETGSDWYHVDGTNHIARKIREGGVDGYRVGGAFADWADDQPQGGGCAILTNAGEWVAASCGTSRGFICDLPIGGAFDPLDDPTPGGGGGSGSGGGGPGEDDDQVLACVDSPFPLNLGLDELPTAEQLAAVEQQVQDCAACTGPCPACDGPFAPPAEDNCEGPDLVNDKPMNCRFLDDFARFPPPLSSLTLCDPAGDWRTQCAGNTHGEFCGRVSVVPTGEEASAQKRNFYVCGPVDPYCAANVEDFDPSLPCGEEQICNPDLVESVIDEETFLDESSLDEVLQDDIVDLFPDPPVIPEDVVIPGFETPGCGTEGEGAPCDFETNHPWCNPNENPIEASDSIGIGNGPTVNPLEDTAGNTDSGGDSGRPIQFDFDPDLNLNYQVGPGLYGDFDLNLEASVSLLASAHLDNFLILPSMDIDILDAKAGGSVKRCEGGLEAHLKLLGHDFLPDLIEDPDLREQFVNLLGIREFGEECEEVQGAYLNALGRAKKAYRDAQEVIRQYRAGIENNRRFGADFCGQLIQAKVPVGFPAIDCASAKPHQVVNAFIDYARYVLQNELAGVSPFPSDGLTGEVDFPNIGDRTSTTIASMNFAIGPIPMNLSIDTFFGYGMTGEATYGLRPAGALAVLDDASAGAEKIAYATANATPYANAGIEVFLGAGFDFGPVAAKLGISGEVTMADVSIPATAGAHILMEGIDDDRLLDEDTAEMVEPDAAPFFPGSGYTAYRFYSGFSLDVDAEIDRILSGQLNAKLVIKFFFFSKSWKKQIAAFTGFSMAPIQLVDVSFDGVELGVIRMPFTFPALARFTEPPPEPEEDDGMGGAPAEIEDFVFDHGRVEKFFHKELCVEPVIQACPQIFETEGIFMTQLENSDRLVAYGSTGADLHDRVKLFSNASPLNGDLAVHDGPVLLRNDVMLNNVYGGDPLELWHRVSYSNLYGQYLPWSLLPVPQIVLESPPLPNYTQTTPLYVYQGQTVELSAGSRYGSVTVYQGGTLILNGEALAEDTPQEFFFNNLTVEPGGIVRVNHAEGAVVVAIANSFTWRGILQNGTGRPNAHVFGVFGTQDVYMQSENGFHGTVVVPNATLELNSRNYYGAYYGKYLEVHQDATLTFHPCEGL